MSTFPETIKIGGVVFCTGLEPDLHDVKPSGERQDLNGWIRYDPSLIMIKAGLSLGRTRLVLLHEILHGLLEHTGREDLPEEEAIVLALAPSLLMVLRDNPALVDYLMHDPEVPGASD